MRRTSKKGPKNGSVTAESPGRAARGPKKSYAETAEAKDADDLEPELPTLNPDTDGEPAGEEEEEDFEVEAILGSRFVKGKQHFKIRWKGYGPADDTWELEDNLNCEELIQEYTKKKGKEEKTAKKASPSKRSMKGKSPGADKPPKKARKSKDAADGDSEADGNEKEDDNTEWEVKKIVDHVDLKDGTKQFRVRWKGYGSKDDSWEPEANLNCPELIQKYLADEEERDNERELRDERKQVFKYNPDLTKRRCHRLASKKRFDESSTISSRSYYQHRDDESSSDSSGFYYHLSRKANHENVLGSDLNGGSIREQESHLLQVECPTLQEKKSGTWWPGCLVM